MIHVVRHRWIWISASLVVFVAGLVFLALGGLRLGTDFTGGSLVQERFSASPPHVSELEQLVIDLDLGSSRVQSAGETSVVIRTRQLSEEEHGALTAALQEKYGDVHEESYSEVGPTLGRELQQKAIVALLLVLAAIIVYISWAFRKISGRLSGWAFGVVAIIALIHDVGITIGAFAFLGYFFNVEIDALFVTAILTVLGFSVHDTIVVFDRIREGLRRAGGDDDLATIIDQSVNDTLIRSINTSLSTLLVLLALYAFGGASIRYFVLALIIGIVVGVYSSIFVASPLLLYWRRRR